MNHAITQSTVRCLVAAFFAACSLPNGSETQILDPRHLKSKATRRFQEAHSRLPESVQEQAREAVRRVDFNLAKDGHFMTLLQ